MYHSKRLDSLLDMNKQERECMHIICSKDGWYQEARAVYYARGGVADMESEYLLTAMRRSGFDKYKTIAYIKRTIKSKLRKRRVADSKSRSNMGDAMIAYMDGVALEEMSIEDLLIMEEDNG